MGTRLALDALDAVMLADDGSLQDAAKQEAKLTKEFCLAFAPNFEATSHGAGTVDLLGVNGHSSAKMRVNGVLQNIDELYGAFDVQEKDAMYTEPRRRTSIF